MPGVTALCYDCGMGEDYLDTMNAASTTVRYVQVEVPGGTLCPACGRKVPMSGAERQRRYRERRRAK